MQRYTWEDGLIEAQVTGKITNGALMTGIKLAHAIKWDAEVSELRWANELAADVVGIGRSTYFRNIKELKSAGFIKVTNNNLTPVLPDSQESTRSEFEELRQSKIDTYKAAQAERRDSRSKNYNPASPKNETISVESQKWDLQVPLVRPASPKNETCESHFDNGYSVHTFSEDTYSVNEYSDSASLRHTSPLRGSVDIEEDEFIRIDELFEDVNIHNPSLKGSDKGSASPKNETSRSHEERHPAGDDCTMECSSSGKAYLEWN